MNPEWKVGKAVRLGLILFVALAGILLLASWRKETHAQNQAPNHVRVPMVTDWSHHHMVYSRPASIADALRLQNEPRYVQQVMRRNAAAPPSAN
jgi:5-methylcytosine-specific restriction endonuclease McrA